MKEHADFENTFGNESTIDIKNIENAADQARYCSEKSRSEELKIIYGYRYLSWALTSAVYMTYGPRFVFLYKLGVIVSLLVSSVIITRLYIKFQKNGKMLTLLVFTESIGIALILFTTGGLKSPFMWYALNPILIAASYLPVYFCWGNLAFYLTLGVLISFRFFNPEKQSIVQILDLNINLLMVFVLITSAVQILAGIAKRSNDKSVLLSQQHKQLEKINNKLEESVIQRDNSLKQIMSMYEIMETFSNENQKEKFFTTLAEYSELITGSDISFFCIYQKDESADNIIANREITNEENRKFEDAVSKAKTVNQYDNDIFYIKSKEEMLILCKITSPSADYGWVGIDLYKNVIPYDIRHIENFLKFLANLSAARLDRFYFEKLEENLLIMEEQNRIANEIHDSVSQRLFSINYSIYALIKNWEQIPKHELWTYLLEFKESSSLAIKELRNSIYGLSTGKRGVSVLKTSLKSFFDSLTKMHGVIINFQADIDENQLTFALKQAITRIIREGCSNAIRHGKAKNIDITITIENYNLYLIIKDDGIGFAQQENEVKSMGLGLSNMRYLVNSFAGCIDIKSKCEMGCEINAVMDIH